VHILEKGFQSEMKSGGFEGRDWRVFLVVGLIVNSPPLLVRVPVIGMLAFIPSLFWVNIPGIPLALIGLPFFAIAEFGAVPKGVIGWSLIVAFWTGIAFVVVLMLKKMRARN